MQTSWSDATTGAFIHVGIGYPFELLKTRSQLSTPGFSVVGDAGTLLRRHGMRGLYHGAAIPFVLTMVSFQSTFFMMNTIERELLTPDPDAQVYSSSIAGMISAVVMNPFEVVKCHRQGHIPFEWSPRLAFRGIFPHILREGVGFASYFGSYLWLYRFSTVYIEPARERRFVCGAVAGAVSTICAFPFDIWKTRSQVITGSTYRLFPWSGLIIVLVRSVLVNGTLFVAIGKD